MFKRLLFPSRLSTSVASFLLLLARVCVGLMFLNHGMQKWLAFGEMSSNFPDPLHIGSAWSLPLSCCVASYDICHGYGILCHSRRFVGQWWRACTHLSVGVRIPLFDRSGKVFVGCLAWKTDIGRPQ